MNVTVISSGTSIFTAHPDIADLTAAISADGDPASVILDTAETACETSDNEHVIIYGDDSACLWSGPLGPHQPGTATIRPAAWLVSIWGGHTCSDSARHTLLVTEQGNSRYAIRAGWTAEVFTLDADGKIHPDDPGNPALRFPLDQALAIAQAHAATIRSGIFTAAEAFARHQAYGCHDA